MTKLEIHKSKNKKAADKRVTDPDFVRRFKNDDGYDEGDWGRADKKYAAGATYDHEMKQGKIIKNSYQPKNPDHEQIKETLKAFGYERGKGGIYLHTDGAFVKYPLPNGSFQIKEGTGMKAGILRQCLEVRHPVMQEEVEPIVNLPLLTGIIREAVEHQTLDTTKCDICGGNHTEATHVKAPGTEVAEVEEARTPGGIKHNPINQKGSLWKQLKKKLQMEKEIPSPEELQKASDGKPEDGKEVLDELGEDEKAPKKPWKVIDMTSQRHVDTVHSATQRGAKTAMSKKGHDSRFHIVREAKKFTPPKFDQANDVRAIARERIGQPKAKVIIKSKKFKQDKYKKNFMNENEGDETLSLSQYINSKKISGKSFKRLKVITTHKGFGQWIMQCDEDPVGYIKRTDLPSPYASGPTHVVYRWEGKNCISVETSHKRYEVYEVPADVTISKTDD